MNKNVGTIDRSVRAVVGIAAIVAYALDMVTGTLGIITLIVGIGMLGTSAIGWCPPYALLGINSCGTKSAE
jgi:hypothetical protein